MRKNIHCSTKHVKKHAKDIYVSKKTFKDIQEHATKHETKNIMTIQNIL